MGTSSTSLLKYIRTSLKKLSDPTTRKSTKRFFKETVTTYGVKTTLVEKLAKDALKEIKDWSKQDVFTICEELWKSGYLEESYIACSFSYAQRKLYVPLDIKIFEHWISTYIHNWASCDTFCNHSVGTLLEMYPDLIQYPYHWTTSKNRWMRRASAVSLIVPARKGLFQNDIFNIADSLLVDKDDLVQKGYGWMLKVLSQKNQKSVFEYVFSHRHTMPRTALRYAIEKMPQELRKKAMGN